MQYRTGLRVHPELKKVVVEASHALAHLDAQRLEELALSCQALTCILEPANAIERAALAREAKEAVQRMAVFSRVLKATRANLKVMHHLRELHGGRLEYGPRPDPAGAPRGDNHGDN